MTQFVSYLRRNFKQICSLPNSMTYLQNCIQEMIRLSKEQYTDSLIKPEDTIGLRMDEILAPENSSNSNKESNRKSSAVKMADEQIAREREMSDKK
jgi:hypothetical protein